MGLVNSIIRKVEGNDKLNRKLFKRVEKNQGFSQYEADYPELRRDWWESRGHRGPVAFMPAAWSEFLDALGAYQHTKAQGRASQTPEFTKASGTNVTYQALARIVEAIQMMEKSGEGNPTKSQAKLLTELAGRLVGTRKSQTNFWTALRNLQRKIQEKPLYRACSEFTAIDRFYDY